MSCNSYICIKNNQISIIFVITKFIYQHLIGFVIKNVYLFPKDML
jgi:hypothetical protein